ncbi:MAG: hypothetical protein ABW203_07825 [Novosphingobium sp.]
MTFELDTTQAFYDITPGDPKSAAPLERSKFVESEIKGPRNWSITVDRPPPTGGKSYVRYEMAMMGDVNLVRFLVSPAPQGPFTPVAFGVNRRQP